MEKIELKKYKTYKLICDDREINITFRDAGIEINNPLSSINIKPYCSNEILLKEDKN